MLLLPLFALCFALVVACCFVVCSLLLLSDKAHISWALSCHTIRRESEKARATKMLKRWKMKNEKCIANVCGQMKWKRDKRKLSWVAAFPCFPLPSLSLSSPPLSLPYKYYLPGSDKRFPDRSSQSRRKLEFPKRFYRKICTLRSWVS